MIKYNWILSNLFQNGEITTDTSFSELLKRLEKSSTMIRMVRFGHVPAKSAFEEFLNNQRAERTKKLKRTESSSNTNYSRKPSEENENDVKRRRRDLVCYFYAILEIKMGLGSYLYFHHKRCVCNSH